MHIHPEEVRWAQVNEKQLPFEPLNRDQVHSIMAGQGTASLV
jgi:hypothetical protein